MKKNYLILGSGIIGLTLAYKIAKLPNTSVFIIEKEKSSGLHASGRNSGVIHSGIYYKPKTLKSIISSSSRYLFRQFLIENNINFNPNGKLIFHQVIMIKSILNYFLFAQKSLTLIHLWY